MTTFIRTLDNEVLVVEKLLRIYVTPSEAEPDATERAWTLKAETSTPYRGYASAGYPSPAHESVAIATAMGPLEEEPDAFGWFASFVSEQTEVPPPLGPALVTTNRMTLL